VLRELLPQSVRGPATLIVGGEALTGESLDGFGDVLARSRVVNEYGPTETVVGACVHELPRGLPPRGNVPIGRPIANTRLHVLNPDLEVNPAALPGEIHIGGCGVARGYLGQPGLTAACFVPDPCGAEPGARLYRTGDLARRLPDGSLEFLGRNDAQLKLHGYRIEPGEIEAALAAHPGVREAVVLAREDRPGHRRLAAYIRPRGDAPDAAALRQFLARRLPDYMVPAALPLTPNGKLDRRPAALPVPEEVRRGAARAYVAPRTPAESVMARIWAQVLDLERVGVDDNFFELGGDSILGVQVIARAQLAGLRLSPGQLFRHQTVGELVAVAGTVAPVAAEQGSVSGPIPLTPIQRWFFDRALPRPGHFSQAVLLAVREPLDGARLARALALLIAHHDALRIRFPRHDGTRRQHNEQSLACCPLIRVDLAGVAAHRRAAALEVAAAGLQRGFDLERGPLFRAAVFAPGAEGPVRLLLVAHHLVVDAVSWRVLLADLEQAYAGLVDSGARTALPCLPPKTTAFRDWAWKLAELAGSEQALTLADYWSGFGRQAAAVPPLPIDLAGGDNDGASERSIVRALTSEETRDLLERVPKAYRTRIDEVLLTALARTFHRFAGEPRLLIQLERHGREEVLEGVDLSRTVGWFTSLFPVVLTCEPGADPGRALRSMKEQLRAVPQQGIGFGIVRFLGGDGALRQELAALRAPEVSFNYLGRLDQALADSALFAPAPEPVGPAADPQGPREGLIEITASVLGQQLHVVWRYSCNRHLQSTIERLAGSFLDDLRALIDHCLGLTADGQVAADVGRAGLGEAELVRAMGLLAQLDAAESGAP
jgi:non-ribosomal peptide synthase protein (TIGR01720 family)